jgi:hypothetical protein
VEPAELERLAKRNPRVYTNPNLPYMALVHGAKEYPWYVDQNPYLITLSLEDPYRYELLQAALTSGWLESGVHKLGTVNRRLFAADCAERVLPFFEEVHLNDSRPRNAIKAAREYARGLASYVSNPSITDLEKAWVETNKATELCKGIGTLYAADAAAECASPGTMVHGKSTAKLASESALNCFAGKARIPERKWQADRLRYYYGLENPGYKVVEVIGAKKPPIKWDDPSVKPEELLRSRNPGVFMNPNLPLEALIKGAKKHPWLVWQNPVIPLLQLEDPTAAQRLNAAIVEGWFYGAKRQPWVEEANPLNDLLKKTDLELYKKLCNAIADGWREFISKKLSNENKRRYAADCVEHVSYLYLRAYPNSDRIETMVSTARKVAAGQLGSEVLLKTNTFKDVDTVYRKSYAAYMVLLAAGSALLVTPAYTLSADLNAIGALSAIEANMTPEDVQTERLWQADRVRYYYGIEHPELNLQERVGGKPKWSNPQLSPAELVKVARRSPRAYTNPQMPMQALIDGAKREPWYVEINPVLALLALEDPTNFKNLQRAISEGWLSEAAVSRLSPLSQRCLAADCAERVLWIYDVQFRLDKTAKHAVDATRAYALGHISLKKLEDAHLAVQKKAQVAAGLFKGYKSFGKDAKRAEAVYFAVQSCRSASTADTSPYLKTEVVSSITYAHCAVGMYQEYLTGSDMAHYEARTAEINWQANQVRHYYGLEHPEYKAPESVGAIALTKKEKPRRSK